MADIVLETERLILRQFGEGDVELHARYLNSPEIMKHIGGVRELHEIEAKQAKSTAGFAREGFGFMLLIEKASGEPVGQAGMKRVDNPLAPNTGMHEIGWAIRPDRWRRGYAGEAVAAIIEWAFTRHGVPELVALTSLSNEASWRLMEKFGMARREDLDFDDPAYEPDDSPVIQYSLTQEQWENSQ
ncbi:GNAT family N-acetyltransferase [Qipengyuania sp. DSG2-2]|uniref:GNAT family N-acetyltransferase n=1 Tax=Qipengyuania sp. DGS2-2 TaxID=3349631 RepID=UPI0036D2D83A